MDIYTATQMNGVPPEEQARRAIAHALGRIREHQVVGYHMGLGSQSFDLLTEAYASLAGIPVPDVRRQFECRNPQSAAGSVSPISDAERTDIDIALLVDIDSRIEDGDLEVARQMIADWIDDLQAEI